MSESKIVADISQLPTYAYGAKNPLWWGEQFFMIIEGLGFAFAVATYFYLYNHNDQWPMGGAKPDLLVPSLMLGLLLLSEIPNVRLKKAAARADLPAVRRGLIIMAAVGVIAVVLRFIAFPTVNVRWDANAYGSITWFILVLHTLHIVTVAGTNCVMMVLVHLGPIDMRRFPEVEDNQDYWHFVVGWWVVIYLVVYCMPRWFGVMQ